jgi:hypothetical protein
MRGRRGSGRAESDADPGKPLSLLANAGIILGLGLAHDLLHWAFGGGGILSILSAVSAVKANAPWVDVDISGLLVVAMFCAAAIVVGLCTLVPVDMSKRGVQAFVLLGIMIPGFAFDMICDEPIIAGQMAAHGYSRCETRDHKVGSGKSSVWFENFVLHAADCPAERQPG